MALEATFRQLTTCFHELYEFVKHLHISMEDKLDENGPAVALDLSDLTLKMMGFIHDAETSAVKAGHALRHPPDMDQARRRLTVCQDKFHLIEEEYAANLLSYNKLRELARVGGRSKEWGVWAAHAKQDIEQCRELLEKTSKALAACWQELAERLGMLSISVTTVGQKIHVPKSGLKDFDAEGVT